MCDRSSAPLYLRSFLPHDARTFIILNSTFVQCTEQINKYVSQDNFSVIYNYLLCCRPYTNIVGQNMRIIIFIDSQRGPSCSEPTDDKSSDFESEK